MHPVKLSICIPTYNRAPYLRDCLERCLRDVVVDFPYEIVISDNCSSDDTEEVAKSFIEKGAPVRYVKGDVNTGMIPNYNSALRHGRGDYVMYLADDDRLVGAEVAAAIHYLEENENIQAYYAPWYITDGVTDVDSRKFYEMPSDMVFEKHAFAEAFNLIVQRHIFPEIAIFRSSAFRAAWVPRDICHPCFPMLAHFLDRGAVAFRKTPFYRQVIRSAVGDRKQGGHELAMTAWDSYRGGLEYLLYFGMKRGRIGKTENDRVTQEHLCQNFTMTRMVVAIRLLVQQNDYIKAYELFTRIQHAGESNHQQLATIRQGLTVPAALQTLVWQIHSTAGIRRLLISDFPETSVLLERLSKLGLSDRIEVVTVQEDHPADMLDRTVVLVPLSQQRTRFEELGYLPNLIFSQEDLTQTILL